jgi:diguanylate cyclase (GGDEF)-like protein
VHRFAGVAAAISMMVGMLVLAGWILDVPALRSFELSVPSMKPNTAIGFILIGLSLWLSREGKRRLGLRVAARSLASLVAVVAALTLAEYILDVDLGIDHLFHDTDTSDPGRPSPHTALAFLVVGLWLSILWSGRGRVRLIRNWLSVLACLIALQAVIGYLYRVPYLSGVSEVNSMTIPTIATFVVVCVGILAARPRDGFMGLMTSAGAGGAIARRTLPVVLGFPLLLGYLRLAAEEKWHLIGLRVGVSIVAGGSVTVLGVLIFLVAQSLDQTDADRGRLEERLRDLAQRDPLTNLFNRRPFEEALEREVAIAARDKHQLGLMILDLDGLKTINDRLGHQAGDVMIVATAKALASQLRSTDWIARLGGDEFGVLLLRTDRRAAENVADKLVKAVRAATPTNRGYTFTISAGLALADGLTGASSTLMAAADAAMYRAKADGGDRYVVAETDPPSAPS